MSEPHYESSELKECDLLIREAEKADDWEQVRRLKAMRGELVECLLKSEYLQAEQAIKAERANTLLHRIYSVAIAMFRWTKE